MEVPPPTDLLMLALLPLVGLAGFTLAICVSWGREAGGFYLGRRSPGGVGGVMETNPNKYLGRRSPGGVAGVMETNANKIFKIKLKLNLNKLICKLQVNLKVNLFRKYKGESPETVLKWTVTDLPPLYLIPLDQTRKYMELLLCVTLSLRIFPKLQEILSLFFCVSPIPHACPI